MSSVLSFLYNIMSSFLGCLGSIMCRFLSGLSSIMNCFLGCHGRIMGSLFCRLYRLAHRFLGLVCSCFRLIFTAANHTNQHQSDDYHKHFIDHFVSS